MLENFSRRLGILMAALSFVLVLVFSGAFCQLGDGASTSAAFAKGPIKAKPAPADSSGSDSAQSDSSDGADAVIVPQDTEGTVRVNNLANLEALLNIVANSVEIMGIASVGSFFVGAIIAFVRHRPILGAMLLVLCPVSLIGGLGTPGVINWLVASARDANLFDQPEQAMLMAIPIIIVVLAVLLGIGFIPAIIAFRANHEHKWIIFFMTFIGWIVPFGWPALLFWALIEARKTDGPKPELL